MLLVLLVSLFSFGVCLVACILCFRFSVHKEPKPSPETIEYRIYIGRKILEDPRAFTDTLDDKSRFPAKDTGLFLDTGN